MQRLPLHVRPPYFIVDTNCLETMSEIRKQRGHLLMGEKVSYLGGTDNEKRQFKTVV